MSESNALGNLANVHSSVGNLRMAIQYHERALTTARELADREAWAVRCVTLAAHATDSATANEPSNSSKKLWRLYVTW